MVIKKDGDYIDYSSALPGHSKLLLFSSRFEYKPSYGIVNVCRNVGLNCRNELDSLRISGLCGFGRESRHFLDNY